MTVSNSNISNSLVADFTQLTQLEANTPRPTSPGWCPGTVRG